jgi:hypothetical protein
MSRGTVQVTQGAKEQAASSRGGFKALEAGKYNVDIFDAEETEIKQGVNAGTKGVRMQFRISPGQKGANRRIFSAVYDVERWKPKEGKTEGAVNFQFFQFYKALGFEMGENFELPDVEDLLGEALTVKLKVVADTYQYNKALAEWQGKEPEEGTEAHTKWESEKPSKGDFLTNEIDEFLPLEELDDLDTAAAGDDEDGFDL